MGPGYSTMNKLQECIPVGCVPPAAVAVGGGGWGSASVYAGIQIPPGVGLETPLGVGPESPQRPYPSTSPFGCGPGDPPPPPDPSTCHLGVGLETCKACWDTTPPRPARHAGIPPAMHTWIPHTPH